MKNNFALDLQLFAFTDAPASMTKTATGEMSSTMKTFYNKSLLENAREESVFDQFAMPTPMTHGKTAEWRRWKTFAPATTPLEEGVIPNGHTFGMEAVTAGLSQHGDYTPISDVLEMTAFDPVIYGATEEMGAAGAETSDILIRNDLLTGTNQIYAGAKSSKSSLAAADTITPALINKAVTFLKKMRAPKINGYYVAVIHPSVAEDLRNSEEWKEFHKYNDTSPIFKGEIGELHGVKFIESNFAKVDSGTNIKVYSTMIFGKDAFGKLGITGGEMQMIIHGKNEIGGPLDQFSTVGYKFMHGARVLYEERLINLWTASSYGDEDDVN
ncbi:MAG: N4-gp56 family major capsid protein [Clostridia bacterium]|nr:N4-gp56 family major capsid protein [Clostridia bacterium]MBQ8836488.1 N4-gp56 family major capsid protein [Clostridia bacterium]